MISKVVCILLSIGCKQKYWYFILSHTLKEGNMIFYIIWWYSLYYVYECKVVGCASSVELFPTTLDPSFLDKGVTTGPTVTQFGPACA